MGSYPSIFGILNDVTLDVQCQNYIELQPTDVETEYHGADDKYISFCSDLSMSTVCASH